MTKPQDNTTPSSLKGPRVSNKVTALSLAGAMAAGVGVAALSGAFSGAASSPTHHRAALASTSCSGPKGAAYIVEAGWDGFAAVDTSDCNVLQSYNVGDRYVKGDPENQNYDSSASSVVMIGSTLYFADTGNSTVAIINSSKLDPSNYNPAEKTINVGLFPKSITVAPGHKYLWVTDTGPETNDGSNYGKISVISVATGKVVSTFKTDPGPRQVSFSGGRAWVVTAKGVDEFNINTHKKVAVEKMKSPNAVLATDQGRTVYIASNTPNLEYSHTTTRGVTVGSIPLDGNIGWSILPSSNGRILYISAPNSDRVLVFNTMTKKVTDSIFVPDEPTSLGLTPNGSELWVGENASGNVAVVSTKTDQVTNTVDLGFSYDPTGMVLTSTPPQTGKTSSPTGN